MEIDFRHPANNLEQYRKSSFFQPRFDALTRGLSGKPEKLTDILTFFENWRYRSLSAAERILRMLRIEKNQTGNHHVELITDTLQEFQAETAIPKNERINILAAFIEYIVFKKMSDNYRQDDRHRVCAYDLLVFIHDKIVNGKRIDVGVIIDCKERKACQIFECKSFPSDISDIKDKIVFLERIRKEFDAVRAGGEECEIYLLTLHSPDAMRQFNITQEFYPTVLLLSRQGIIERIFKRPPLCNCKTKSEMY